MTLDEILKMSDIAQKIEYLKKGRRTLLPDAGRLHADWDPNKHEIVIDKSKYPEIEIVTEASRMEYNPRTKSSIEIPSKKEKVEPNRISLPIEQDIVNIHTAFTVGIEPEMDCEPSEKEKGLFTAMKLVLQKSKIKYQNKAIVRSWLSEQEVAEYWYVVNDDGFWERLKSKISEIIGAKSPTKKLRSVIWSPFRGDKLYPFFDDSNDMVAFSREYQKKLIDGTEVTCFMTITKDFVYQWELNNAWQDIQDKSFKHGLGKIPVLYAYRPQAYCDKIKALRIRLEKLMSNYADCIDYHFFPILMLYGQAGKLSGKFKNRVVELTGEKANAAYLTWNQVPETVKFEAEQLLNQIYSLTNTPRISFDSLKGTGNALSGTAFRYVFMGAHMSVENHAEVIGEFMQRRVNFLISALGSINTSFDKASKSIDVDVNIVPYIIDDLSDKVKTAVAAVDGGVWSRREGILFAGNSDRIDDEIKEIEDEQEKSQSSNASDKAPKAQNTMNG